MGDGRESTLGTSEYEKAQLQRRIAKLEEEVMRLTKELEIATNVAKGCDPALLEMLREANGLPAHN